MKYYLGIDIGTTSSKAIAFSESGDVITAVSHHYEMFHPQPDRSEQDPDEILAAVVSGINEVLKNLAPHKPTFISFSAAMHSLIALDDKGGLLTPCIIWADNRADEIAMKLRDSDDGSRFYRSSGVPIHSMSPLCKLLWLKQQQPEIFKKAFKFIGIKEYVFYRFFGSFVVDTSIASATGLLNLHTLQWDPPTLDYLQLDRLQLSEVVSSKTIYYYTGIYPTLSLDPDIPIIIGASDGALSNLGSGASGTDTMVVTVGTSSAARLIAAEPETDNYMRTFCYHIKDNLFITGGANNNGAVVLQWLKESLLQINGDYEDLFKQAETISAGSEGLLFLPYILGERAPLWNSNAKGVFYGLQIQHTRAHMIRAAMEGVIFSLYSIAKILAEKRTITEICASGGFAKSSMWLQILADVSNLTVVVPGTVESSALGAVMLGAEAMNIETVFNVPIVSTHSPNAVNRDTYRKQFEKFQRLYELLKEEMTNE
jgi:gluconokinase